MISYAHNGEDVLLRRVFGDRKEGFYIDVGAHHPVHFSLTKHFYDLGWHGVDIDANPALAAALRRARPRDTVLNVGISNQRGSMTFFEFPPEWAGLSTFDEQEALRHAREGRPFTRRTVETLTLRDVFEAHRGTPVDFLSIDVEGHEARVLQGADFSLCRPTVLIVESTRPLSAEPTHQAWESIVLEADYQFATFDGLNRYYVRKENAELIQHLQVPVNVLDDFVPWKYEERIRRLRGELRYYRFAFRKVLKWWGVLSGSRNPGRKPRD
jgi:FkbM family methyltransferase